MLQPKNNIFRKTNSKIQSNTGLNLSQVIHNKPIITTLNDVIQQYNTTDTTVNNQTNNNKKVQYNPKVETIINTPNNNDDSSLSQDSTYSTDLVESSSDSNSPNEFKSSSKSKSFSSSSSSFLSTSSTTSYIPSETKFYWEYGNTGLKIKEFKKKMSRNLSTMYYIDRLFNEYIDTVLTNSYAKLFSANANTEYKLKTGSIKTHDGKVIVTLTHKKLTGTYRVLDAGFISLSDIAITDKELKQNSIPNLESILSHKENVYHITKIIKLFNLGKKMRIKSNVSNSTPYEKITTNANIYLDNLVKHDNKNKILKSNKNSGFYIKMYNNHGKGFIIDGTNNIIYYVAVNINFKSANINLRYYAFNIKDGNIIKFKD
jgi:hypothetical protein